MYKCSLAWNILFLPVKKPGINNYCPVQDLQEVNRCVADIHPTVPNPYILLSSLPHSRIWYMVLNLMITESHALESMIRQPPALWLTNTRITRLCF